jgi:nucleotide-binding universal stress UspA family protein
MTCSTIMAHLELGRSNSALLKATAALAKVLDADVIGVAACQPVQILYGEVYVAGELMQLDRDEDEREIHQAEAEFRAELAGFAGRVEWRSAVTCFPLSEHIAREARAADLIVTSPDRGGVAFESTRRTSIADLVLSAGRPVIILPAGTQAVDIAHVLVAWKDTRESRRAALDSLPFLTRAGQVSVVEVADEVDLPDAQARVADVARWLHGHGVKAEARAAKADRPAAAQLGSIADEIGAGLIVAGAYGHTRFREWVLGGVTRELLMQPRRCALMSH